MTGNITKQVASIFELFLTELMEPILESRQNNCALANLRDVQCTFHKSTTQRMPRWKKNQVFPSKEKRKKGGRRRKRGASGSASGYHEGIGRVGLNLRKTNEVWILEGKPLILWPDKYPRKITPSEYAPGGVVFALVE